MFHSRLSQLKVLWEQHQLKQRPRIHKIKLSRSLEVVLVLESALMHKLLQMNSGIVNIQLNRSALRLPGGASFRTASPESASSVQWWFPTDVLCAVYNYALCTALFIHIKTAFRTSSFFKAHFQIFTFDSFSLSQSFMAVLHRQSLTFPSKLRAVERVPTTGCSLSSCPHLPPPPPPTNKHTVQVCTGVARPAPLRRRPFAHFGKRRAVLESFAERT